MHRRNRAGRPRGHAGGLCGAWRRSTGSGRSFRLVVGGKERQDSVWNGLEALSPGAEIVAIQDAARPCTSPALIAATVAAARETGAAVAAQPSRIRSRNRATARLIERTLDRSRLWAVQTPQTFRVEIIRRALSEVRQRGLLVTDDTAACELIGQPVQLVLSTQPNPKVTRPEDLPCVEALLRGMAAARPEASKPTPSSHRLPQCSHGLSMRRLDVGML